MSSVYNIKDKSLSRTKVGEMELHIVQFNCNGLSKKLSEFKILVYTKKPDVICLCETWIKRREHRFVGYIALWQHRIGAEKRGIAILLEKMLFIRLRILI